jgi:hypothetical protein
MPRPCWHEGLLIAAAIVVVAGCSDPSRRVAVDTPTGPSALAIVQPDAGGVSRPATVPFPARPDVVDFRHQLETKYASGLGRPVTTTYVDIEGEAAWVGEYDRYRVNGCDHNTATVIVMAQIDGAAATPVCAVRYFPETAIYPPREHLVDFRRQLGTKYQGKGSTAQSAVDPEGAAIWIGEYLHYRTSGCDHALSVQQVMTQVDGNPAPATCLQQCAYSVSPSSASAPATGGNFTAQLVRASGACEWIAESEVPWIVMVPPITGTDRGVMTYAVAANSGGSRRGTIRVSYPGGVTHFDVNQDAPGESLSFHFFDPATSTSPTTECQLKALNTICTLFATSTVFSSTVTYSWTVEYTYKGAWVRTQTGNLPTFSFSEACGTPGSVVPVKVTLTATDTSGIGRTLISGQGSQPALQLRPLACP